MYPLRVSRSPSRYNPTSWLSLTLFSGLILPAQAKGSSSGSSSEEETGSGGLDEAFANVITKMLQSWRFATFGMAIFGGLFALILVLVSCQAVSKYGRCKRDGDKEGGLKRRSDTIRDKDKNTGKGDKTHDQAREAEEGSGNLQLQTPRESQGQLERPKPTSTSSTSTPVTPTDTKLNKATWNTSLAFCQFSLAGSCSLAAFYPLFIVNQLHIDNGTLAPIPIPGLTILTSCIADISIACAFLALVRRRVRVHFGSGQDIEPEPSKAMLPVIFISSPRLKMVIDGAVVLLMASLAVINSALACLDSTYGSERRFRVLVHLLQVYRASYFLITIDVIGSAFLLDTALMKAKIKDELIAYTLCVGVCPLLALQALFWLVDIIVRAAVPAQKIKQDALLTVEVGFMFVCYTWALFNGLSGFSPKKSK